MSMEINNREYRQQVLREMIGQLHDGHTVEEVKERFAAVFGGVSAEEIAQAEQALIQNGLPVAEVQRLCDVHAAVFKGSIEEIHAPADPSAIPGHPANILKQENRAIEALVDELRALLEQLPDVQAKVKLKNGLKRLGEIDRHYLKKENLYFPYMEKYGITAPPKVMWGVDDEIRAGLKDAVASLNASETKNLGETLDALLTRITEMVFKEENIMLPMLLENLSREEWETITAETDEIGYCLIEVPAAWKPAAETTVAMPATDAVSSGQITLPTGVLKVEELTRMLDALPFDITFVDKDDTVRYFSQSTERVFPRTKAVIGRKVVNCHPPASVHIVEQIIEDFRAGRKDHEDFWIQMKGQFILIRYYAVRGEAGEYLGVLEVTQNIRPIQEITGEKRLVSE